MSEWSVSRRALIIATDKYLDRKLKSLRSPVSDVEQLSRVLSDPDVGSFQITVASNETEAQLRRRVSAFFSGATRDEVLLLHVACHGVKDDDGNLYFAATDTEIDALDATAVSSEWLTRQIEKSRSKRIVVVLDCCYSGAFAPGMAPRGDAGVEIKERFDGSGRVVLTSSSSMEYAWEGDALSGEPQPSIFTGALVDGLSGRADRDRDGWISVDELYDYVFDHVREAAPQQSPTKVGGVEGTIFIARSPATREIRPAELPSELRRALSDASPFAREGAVRELARLLRRDDESIIVAARVALEGMRDDDSRRVVAAVNEALATEAISPPGLPASYGAAEPEKGPSPQPDAVDPDEVVASIHAEPPPLDQLELKSLGSPGVGQTRTRFDVMKATQIMSGFRFFRHGEEEIVIATHLYGMDPWNVAERVLIVTDRRLVRMKKNGTVELSIPYAAVKGLDQRMEATTFPFGKKMLVITYKGQAGIQEMRVRGLGKESQVVGFISVMHVKAAAQ